MLPLLLFSTNLMLFSQSFSLKKAEILGARENAIVSGYFKFSVIGSNAQTSMNRSYDRIHEVWISKNRIREDISLKNGERQITCFGCEQMDLVLSSFTTKSRSALVEKIKGEVPAHLLPSDPRKLGYVLNDYFGYRHARLDGLFNLPGMGEPTITQVNLDGLDCLRFAWGKCSNGWKPTIWTAPSQGNNIVKIEVVSPSFVGFVRSDLAKDSVSGIWFPKKTHFEMKEGDVLTRQETIQVEKVVFNAPEIEQGFYLDNMKLPEGTLVNFPKGMGDAVIKNGKLSRDARTAIRDEQRPKSPGPVRPVSGASWLPYGILSGVLLLLTVVVMFWRKKSVAS